MQWDKTISALTGSLDTVGTLAAPPTRLSAAVADCPMTSNGDRAAAGGDLPRRLFVYNGGFLTQRRVRRILASCGYRHACARHAAARAIWSASGATRPPRSAARRVAARHRRAAAAGRGRLPALAPPGARRASRRWGCCSTMRACISTRVRPRIWNVCWPRIRWTTRPCWTARAGPSRGCGRRICRNTPPSDPDLRPPAPGYVLVIDQTRGDASVTREPARIAPRFREMLVFAQEEHPGARILIKTHPETARGPPPRPFHRATDAADRIDLC